MPHFWIFMYRVSPFTYFVSAVLSTGVANTRVHCAANEILSIVPPAGQTCIEYLGDYLKLLRDSDSEGDLLNPNATDSCRLCQQKWTNDFLGQLQIDYADRWRNIGLLFVYIAFNIFGAIALYWLLRVPKKWGKKKKE